jgi:hypothetical protein
LPVEVFDGFEAALDEEEDVLPVLLGLLGLKMLDEDVEVLPVLLGLSDLLGFDGLLDCDALTPAPTAAAAVNGNAAL